MQLLDARASSLSLSQINLDIQYGDRTRLCYAYTSQTADLERNVQSDLLLRSGNALKCLIISAGLWLDYLQTSLFISKYQAAVGIISPFEFANKASHFQNKFWENHDLTVQPVITYIYLCGQIYAPCLSHFSNHHFVMDQKPN